MSYEPRYYTADADVWCLDCITSRYGSDEGTDSEGNDIGAAFEGEDSDSPQHCAGCGCFLENTLTGEGYQYVIGAVIEALAEQQKPAGGVEHGRIALTEWADFYDVPTGLEPDRYAERFDIVEGAYWACADYHSGQWSRGYRHLCKLGRYFKPGAMASSSKLQGDALAAYVRVAVSLMVRP